PLAHVDEAASKAVALRPPPVLIEQEQRFVRRGLSPVAAPEQAAAETAKNGCDAERIVKQRTDIGDAQLKRWKPCRGAQVPPDLGCILDHTRTHQRFDRAAIVAPARKPLRHALAR